MFKSKGHRLLYDSGVVNPPFFEIIDGKKVYSKWAGVNQPRSPIWLRNKNNHYFKF